MRIDLYSDFISSVERMMRGESATESSCGHEEESESSRGREREGEERRTDLVLEVLDLARVERARREPKVGELDVARRVDEEVLWARSKGVRRVSVRPKGEALLAETRRSERRTSGLRSRWM